VYRKAGNIGPIFNINFTDISLGHEAYFLGSSLYFVSIIIPALTIFKYHCSMPKMYFSSWLQHYEILDREDPTLLFFVLFLYFFLPTEKIKKKEAFFFTSMIVSENMWHIWLSQSTGIPYMSIFAIIIGVHWISSVV